MNTLLFNTFRSHLFPQLLVSHFFIIISALNCARTIHWRGSWRGQVAAFPNALNNSLAVVSLTERPLLSLSTFPFIFSPARHSPLFFRIDTLLPLLLPGLQNWLTDWLHFFHWLPLTGCWHLLLYCFHHHCNHHQNHLFALSLSLSLSLSVNFRE